MSAIKIILIIGLIAPLLAVMLVFGVMDSSVESKHDNGLVSAEYLGAKSVYSVMYEGRLVTAIRFPWDWRGDNEDFKKLHDLKGDVAIQCRCREINDIGFMHLAQIPGLIELWVDHANITDESLNYLIGSKIETLGLYGIPITDKGLEILSKIKSLREIDLRDTDITNNGMMHLAKLDKLIDIRLWETEISDEGIIHIVGLKDLKELNLGYDSKVSEEMVAKLKSLMPNTTVKYH